MQIIRYQASNDGAASGLLHHGQLLSYCLDGIWSMYTVFHWVKNSFAA
jgi:hypothetical protein